MRKVFFTLQQLPDCASNQITAILLLSLVFGVFFGIQYPQWQVALEGAQVLSGITEYPSASPQGIYQAKLWTILNQVLALLLRGGFEERFLASILTGVGAFVFFFAASLLCHSLSHDWRVSVLAPLVILATDFGGAGAGVGYPVLLLDTPHTYGWIGMSMTVLVVALFGIGRHAIGFFLLGLSPSIHPSWGIWLNAACLIYFALNSSRFFSLEKRLLVCLVFGYSISLFSLGVAVEFNFSGLLKSELLTPEIMMAYFEHWESHRVFKHWTEFSLHHAWPGQLAFIGFLASIALYLVYSATSQQHGEDGVFLATGTIIVGGAIAWLLSVWVWVDPNSLPSSISMLMPTRYLNLLIFVFFPILIGLVSRKKLEGAPILLGLVIPVFVVLPFSEIPTSYGRWFLIVVMVSFFLSVISSDGRWESKTLERLQATTLLIAPWFLVTPFSLYFYPDWRMHLFFLTLFSGWILLLSICGKWYSGRIGATRSFSYLWAVWVAGGINAALTPLLMRDLIEPLSTKYFLVIGMFLMGALTLRAIKSRIYKINLPTSGIDSSGMKANYLELKTWRDRALSYRPLFRGAFFGWLAMVSVAGAGSSSFFGSLDQRSPALKDYTNDPFWTELSRREGLILTGSNVKFIQLKSRCPILLDGSAFDYLPYLPETGNAIVDILKIVYGVNFFSREDPYRGGGGLMRDEGRLVWESRTRLEWLNLMEQYKFSTVVAYDDWTIDLSLIARGEGLAAYGSVRPF
jgi:hypothetical protein